MNTFGLILAGGEGSRLGQVRKADIRLGGQSLLERVTSRLRTDAPFLLVSTGRMSPNREAPWVELADLDLPLGGPLAGLVAGIAHLRAISDPDAIIVSVAVDTPFLPDDFVPRLTGTLGDRAHAAQARWHGNVYPTNAAWRLAHVLDLPERVAAGKAPNSPKGLLAELNTLAVDWGDSHELDPFANLNTLEDLVGLTRRAQASSE